MSRMGALAAAVCVAVLGPACGNEATESGHMADGSPIEAAERICDAYRPTDDPNAELLAFFLTTVEALEAALETFEHPPMDLTEWGDDGTAIASCSYSSSSRTSAPTTVCADGESIPLSNSLQFFVRSDGVAIEYPQSVPDAESVPCLP